MGGRLGGEQNNSYGEAMALLQVLRFAPLQSNLTVYIDNAGVIDRWEHITGHGSGRLKRGGRAIWNRIYMLNRARQGSGVSTEVRWVHSHVEGGSARVLRCACAYYI